MVDVTPSNSLLAALASQFAAARQGQSQGSSSVIPGLQGLGGQESAPSTPTGASPVAGGGIPGTATTGPAVANSLVNGGGFAGDPISQSVAGTLLSRADRQPGERGDLGGGLVGGDPSGLLTILGGPLAPASLLASLVLSDAFTGIPDPNLLNTGSLADLVSSADTGQSFQDLFSESVRRGAEFGGTIDRDGRVTGDFGTLPTATSAPASFPAIRAGVAAREESEIDRGRSPGAGPNRGASNAGNRGR